MVSYYTALCALAWMALGVLCILVWENSWIPREDKRLFYLTYGIIAFSAFAEWVGVQLSGNTAIPGWVLSVVKCVDYVFTPMVGGAIVAQMKLRSRWSTALRYVLVGNMIFQIVSLFNGWMVVVDAQNHYAHGPLYPLYAAVYIAVVVLLGAQFLVYGQSYRRQNRTSLYSVLLLVLVGIGMQEALGGEYRTVYIALTLGAALMFIHYSEFYQMSADDRMQKQRDQLMEDALSGALSRHAYMRAMEQFGDLTALPEDLAAFTVDINGLKMVNDTVGHDAGDELIVGAARCLKAAIGEDGECYRTGGDEFVVLAHMDRPRAEAALERLKQQTRQWTGDTIQDLSLSAGFALACEHPDITAAELVKKADQGMYAAKAEYYRTNGHDRRGTRG